jgi:PleD family two-component response regulator
MQSSVSSVAELIKLVQKAIAQPRYIRPSLIALCRADAAKLQHYSKYEPDNGNTTNAWCPPFASTEVCYLVDDDPSVRKSIRRLLESAGFNVRAFGEQKISSIMATNPVRHCLDIWMERMTGMELLAHLCEIAGLV